MYDVAQNILSYKTYDYPLPKYVTHVTRLHLPISEGYSDQPQNTANFSPSPHTPLNSVKSTGK
jgi:hypothetical protein